MFADPPRTALYVGLCVGALFLILHFARKRKPNYMEFAKVVLSVTACIVATDLFVRLLRMTPDSLGDLRSHRLPLVFGAISVIWVSIQSLWTDWALLFKKGES